MNRIRRELSYDPEPQVFTLAGWEPRPIYSTIEIDVAATPVEGQPGCYTCEIPAIATMRDVLVVNPILPGENIE